MWWCAPFKRNIIVIGNNTTISRLFSEKAYDDEEDDKWISVSLEIIGMCFKYLFIFTLIFYYILYIYIFVLIFNFIYPMMPRVVLSAHCNDVHTQF